MAKYLADSNLLLRHFLHDDPIQSLRAGRWLEKTLQSEEIYITDTVVAETLWVMTHAYEIPIERAAEQLLRLLEEPRLLNEHKARMIKTLQLAANTKVPYTDAYLAVLALEEDLEVVTLDQKDFRKLPCKWIKP